MSAETSILAGRRAAEELMVDTAQVREAPGQGSVMDPATGEIVETLGAVIYQGPFKIQSYDAYEQSPESGGHQFVVQRFQLHFPISAPRMLEDYRVECVASGTDSHNVGRRFRIAAPQSKTFSTAQRVNSDELVGR